MKPGLFTTLTIILIASLQASIAIADTLKIYKPSTANFRNIVERHTGVDLAEQDKANHPQAPSEAETRTPDSVPVTSSEPIAPTNNYLQPRPE